MATAPENLRKQLALAVRNIQWSYAIFWATSPSKPGVLEWCDGYYNGDIRTRKTVQAVELNADPLGLQRSDQLRELFYSLELGETNPQAKRPTAALSPEDLTDAEWYFMVCMSFVFNIGQGLPGKTLAKNQTFWLCNAHQADTKVFSRSLLAKSASIKTIVCFPHLEGVVELGATELVPEDENLINHIKASFLESPSVITEIHNNVTNNNDLIFEVVDDVEDEFDQLLDCQDVDMCSPNGVSDDFADNLLRDDDAISNCVNISGSSDCISQTYGNPEIFVPLSENQGTGNQECDNQKHINSDVVQGDDIHYQSVLSNLLKSSQELILGPSFRNRRRESCFVGWKKDVLVNARQTGPPQKLLKKVLFEVAKMHETSRLQSSKRNTKKDGASKASVDDNDRNHVLSERKRREKMNERFMILGSLVPSGGKADKISILDHTIEYLRELENKLQDLQQNKHRDDVERTSDNYGPTRIINAKLTNKRKAFDIDKRGAESSNGRSKDNITIKITDKDVIIEMSCVWKESVLIEVMEAVRKLRLDSESVQSSNTDGILSITIKAKSKILKVASVNVIKQALLKIIHRT